MKNEKGITLIILIITILILVIVTSILAFNAIDSVEVSNITKLNSDVKTLESRIATYFVENDALPVKGASMTKSQLSAVMDDLNSNDGELYYALDLSKLDNPTLYYGRGEGTYSKDIYIVNADTHTVYYLTGVEYEGALYHTTADY